MMLAQHAEGVEKGDIMGAHSRISGIVRAGKMNRINHNLGFGLVS